SPCRCSSQSFFRFSKARMDVGVMPATYSLSSQRALVRRRGRLALMPSRVPLLVLLRLDGADRLEVAIDRDSFFSKSKAVHAHVVRHAPALQQVERPDPFCSVGQVPQYQPAIHQDEMPMARSSISSPKIRFVNRA